MARSPWLVAMISFPAALGCGTGPAGGAAGGAGGAGGAVTSCSPGVIKACKGSSFSGDVPCAEGDTCAYLMCHDMRGGYIMTEVCCGGRWVVLPEAADPSTDAGFCQPSATSNGSWDATGGGPDAADAVVTDANEASDARD